jgi:folylpolyglutamate synthase/dihydropteroate synthase
LFRQILELEEPNAWLRVVHVAGTKGKVSVQLGAVSGILVLHYTHLNLFGYELSVRFQ